MPQSPVTQTKTTQRIYTSVRYVDDILVTWKDIVVPERNLVLWEAAKKEEEKIQEHRVFVPFDYQKAYLQK